MTVLQLSAAGKSNEDIASALSIAVKTVEVHKASAMRKLQLRDRSDVIRFAVVKGWLQNSLSPWPANLVAASLAFDERLWRATQHRQPSRAGTVFHGPKRSAEPTGSLRRRSHSATNHR